MSILTIVIILLLIGTVGSLIFGVVVMAKGGTAAESGRRQNKLMVYRIWFQAAAILVITLVFYITKK